MARHHVRIALDSSYLVPLLSDLHAHHKPTQDSYERCIERGDEIVLPIHAVLECYSVLTRMPPPYRLSADIAQRTIADTFSRIAVVVGVKSAILWDYLLELAARHVIGGRVYDALIARCAADAGATLLLTWNPKHFVAIAPPGLEIQEPDSRALFTVPRVVHDQCGNHFHRTNDPNILIAALNLGVSISLFEP